MVAINSVNVGDVLWDCRKVKQGNTHIRRMACWQVRILEKNEDGSFMASWNGNAPRRYGDRQLSALRRTKKES